MVDIFKSIVDDFFRTDSLNGYGANITVGGIEYWIANNDGRIFEFIIDAEVFEKNLLDSRKEEKLKNLFYHKVWPNGNLRMKIDDLINFIDSNYPSDSVLEKQDRVLSLVRSQSDYDGAPITIILNDYALSQLWRKTYVQNIDEFCFYIDSLIKEGYLSCPAISDSGFHEIALTVSGLGRIALNEESTNSKTCFVAMSFDKSLRGVYDEAIFPALKETGFESLRIDDDYKISSDVTINDALLAAIKKSKFTIADFTQHKKGVYFEAGYALGRGQKVIYTCHEDEINDAHFDTRNYPHVVWKDAEDLKKKLIDKIEVFIKE